MTQVTPAVLRLQASKGWASIKFYKFTLNAM
jgi:hypothetical protein